MSLIHRMAAIARQLTLLMALGLLVAACGTETATTPASASASTSPTGSPSDELPDLSSGSYSLSGFPVGITVQLPAAEPPSEWSACSASPTEQGVCLSPDPGGAVVFQIVENVRTPPCSDQDTAELLDPPVGPSVDDFVTAVANLEGYEATPAQDISVSGFSGKEFMLTAQSHGCGATWSTADRVTGMGAGEVNVLRVVDVDGVRVVITNAYHPGTTPDADVAALEQVMDSVQIQP